MKSKKTVANTWLLHCGMILCAMFVLDGCDGFPSDVTTPQAPQILAANSSVIHNAWSDERAPRKPQRYNPSCLVPPPSSLYDAPEKYPYPAQPMTSGQSTFSCLYGVAEEVPDAQCPPVPGSRCAPSLDDDGNPQQRPAWNPPIPGSAASPGSGSGSSAGASTPPPVAPVPSAPTTPVAQEADIIRIIGEHVYILSETHGLLIFSLKEPSAIKRLGQLKLSGKPVEMFVEGSRAFVFVNPATQSQPNTAEQGPSGALFSIDIERPETPTILSQIPIQGSLWEGGTRKKGNVFYAVSYVRSRTQTSHCSIPDVAHPHQLLASVIQVDDKGQLSTRSSTQLLHDELHPRTTFRGLTITMSDTVLLVSEYREGSEWSWGCPRNVLQETVVNVLAIEPEGGDLAPLSRFSFEGFLTDQHKQAYFQDEKTSVPYYYGVLQIRASKGSDIKAATCIPPELHVANRLITVSLQLPRIPRLVHSLSLGKLNEEVRGSLFDLKRRVLYAITTETDRSVGSGGAVTLREEPDPDTSPRVIGRDPLYVIGLHAPERPKILSAIDGLDGEINFFRAIQDGGFLVAIGRDRTGHCTGFSKGQGDSSGTTRVAVSLLDVRDADKARLVQRKCFGFLGVASASDAQRNLDQGHKQIALHMQGQKGLLALPVGFSTSGAGNQSAIGLMALDLSSWANAPQESLCQTCLNDRDAVQLDTSVKRIQLIGETSTQSPQLWPSWVLGLSDQALTVAPLSTPHTTQTTMLALEHSTRYAIKGGVAELFRVGGRDLHLQIQPDASNGITPDLIRIDVPGLLKILPWNGALILVQYAPATKEEPSRSADIEVRVLQLSTDGKHQLSAPLRLPQPHPFVPEFTSTLDRLPAPRLPAPIVGSQRQTLQVLDIGLLGTTLEWVDRKPGHGLLFFVDLRQPMKPTLKRWTLPGNVTDLGLVKVDSRQMYFTYVISKEISGASSNKNQELHHYVEPLRWSEGEWIRQQHFVIPGTLLAVHQHQEGHFFLTADQQAFARQPEELGFMVQDPKGTYTEVQWRLHLSRLTEGKATLIQTLPLGQWRLDEMKLATGTLTLLGQHSWFALREQRKMLTPDDNMWPKRVFQLSPSGFVQDDAKP